MTPTKWGNASLAQRGPWDKAVGPILPKDAKIVLVSGPDGAVGMPGRNIFE